MKLTAKERMAKTRQRRKERGLTRRDVWATKENWPKIRKLEKILQGDTLNKEEKYIEVSA